jgi:filamentous hemagglutinin family protein
MLFLSCALAGEAIAGVTIDGTLSPATALAGPKYQINEAYGLRAGANLFQSLGQFSIATGESAVFNVSNTVANIIGRVTGGALSSIDGQLSALLTGSTTRSGANVYLINPAGIMFGPNASLNLGGSFYASSANYIKLADGSLFHATAPATSTLTSAPPAAFGFLGGNGAVTVNGSHLNMALGKTLGLIGGNVVVQDDDGSSNKAFTLHASSGRIDIASIVAGEAGIGAQGFDVSAAAALGTVTLRGNAAAPATNSTLDVSEQIAGLGGGGISIRGGRIVLEEGAKLRANTAAGNGRQIELSASGDVSITGGVIEALTRGAGNAGGISISGDTVTVTGAARIDTSCNPGCTTGAGGALNITAASRFSMFDSPASSVLPTTGAVSNVFGSGSGGDITVTAPVVSLAGPVAIQANTQAGGNSGIITINAGQITLSGGAQISAFSSSTGNAGKLNVAATQGISVIGTRLGPNAEVIPSGLIANVSGAGGGGLINVNAGSVSVLGGGEISTSVSVHGDTTGAATGNGGTIAISSSGPVVVSGYDPGAPVPAGDTAPGKVSGILVNTFGPGNGGTLVINAPVFNVSNYARVQSQTEGAGSGAGGSMMFNVGALSLSGGGQISTDTRGSGAGGEIRALASGAVNIAGIDSGLFANSVVNQLQFVASPGRSGSIAVSAAALSIANGGAISARTETSGAGGRVSINTSDSTALTSGASILARSTGSGDAGQIYIDAGRVLTLDNAQITTQASTSDGGNIAIFARDLISLNKSRITTAVGNGLGNGGNIALDPTFLVLNASSIIADAFGGNGGNINIVADNLFRSPDSVVSASSQLGVNGTIIISSPVIDVTNSLVSLPATYRDASGLLSSLCAARLAGKASSLVVAGRGGLPYNADSYLPVFALGGDSGNAMPGGLAGASTVKVKTSHTSLLSGCGGG